jgi:hypothetical protein
MLQFFEVERFLFDRMIPCGREALQQELATSGARAAQIAFLNAIHNFLRDWAFAPASECYASNAPDIVRSRLFRMPRGKLVPATRAISGGDPWTAKI